MSITMSPAEYAGAWRLITSTSIHDKNIEEVLRAHVLPGLRKNPTLLDVGAGPGVVARRLAPHFAAMTLIEQNPSQIEYNRAELENAGATVFCGSFDEFRSQERYDVVLCSHVFYHVSRSQWSAFIDRLLSFVRPGGVCLVILVGGPTYGSTLPAARLPASSIVRPPSHTTHYAMRKAFTDQAVDTAKFVTELSKKHIPFIVEPTMNWWTAKTLDEMYAICRFVVLEDCYTPEQIAKLTQEEAQQLDRKIRAYAEACPFVDGLYRLEMEDGITIIPGI